MDVVTEIDLDKAEAALGSTERLCYRAEGNANLVMSLPHKCLVLRLQKSYKQQTDDDNVTAGDQMHVVTDVKG